MGPWICKLIYGCVVRDRSWPTACFSCFDFGRKPLLVLGYSMGALSKPIFALSNSFALVFSARLFDRTGKGIRGAPRDALVADLAPQEIRGRAFGLRQSMDTIGAFLGPILAIGLMYIFAQNFRLVFWIATIPGLIAVMIIVFFVKEKKGKSARSSNKRIHWKDLSQFPQAFWFVAGAGALFQLARFSEAFLILRGTDLGLSAKLSPLVLIVLNLVYAATAYPMGHLSDRIRREWFLFFGLVVLVVADLFLASGVNLLFSFVGIALWGLHLGLTQGILAALVADSCTPERRGSAYGIFNLFSAVALLIASVGAGWIWDKNGPQMTFTVGALIAAFSLIVFFMTKRFWVDKTSPGLTKRLPVPVEYESYG